ncbi:hypothetical protein Dimus_001454 [Dionaea muscipula]
MLNLWLFCRWDLLQGGWTCWRTEAEVRRVSSGAGCWVDNVDIAYGWAGTHGSRWLGLKSFPSRVYWWVAVATVGDTYCLRRLPLLLLVSDWWCSGRRRASGDWSAKVQH